MLFVDSGETPVLKAFCGIFSDSNIAKTFACGGDKTAYVTKFLLAEHVKKRLVSQVNNGAF